MSVVLQSALGGLADLEVAPEHAGTFAGALVLDGVLDPDGGATDLPHNFGAWPVRAFLVPLQETCALATISGSCSSSAWRLRQPR